MVPPRSLNKVAIVRETDPSASESTHSRPRVSSIAAAADGQHSRPNPFTTGREILFPRVTKMRSTVGFGAGAAGDTGLGLSRGLKALEIVEHGKASRNRAVAVCA
eukprot:scaffold170600_cov31-Tisochrysis_lutea.AAC.6